MPLKFQREGIKYDDLSEEDKQQWDELEWGDDGAPDQVAAGALNKWLFNEDTVDKVLEQNNVVDQYNQNKIIQSSANDIIDFTERNPFGEV